MKISTYQELNRTLKELCRERDDLQAQIDDNNLSIKEAQRLAKEILDREDEDFKVFSPRKIEDLHKVELEQFDLKKINLERQNGQLTFERDKLNKIIHVMQLVLEEVDEEQDSTIDNTENDNISDNGNMEESNSGDAIDDKEKNNNLGNEEIEKENPTEISIKDNETVNDVDSVYDSISENIKNLKHRIDLSYKFIPQDFVRAKQELEIISKGMDKLLTSVENVSREKH